MASRGVEIAMWSRLLFIALLLLPAAARAGVKEKVAALAPAALVYVVDAEGNELVAQNADKPFVPASVTKLVTTWLALETLGKDYRFETRFYLDAKRTLYVRGGGDPFLVSEELAQLAQELVAERIRKQSGMPRIDAPGRWQTATLIPVSENEQVGKN